jgi:hypothetical protein
MRKGETESKEIVPQIALFVLHIVVYIQWPPKKSPAPKKNARLFSGILSNDPKLFIFFS